MPKGRDRIGNHKIILRTMAEEKIFLGYISKSEAADIEPKIERLAGLEEHVDEVRTTHSTTWVT